MRASFPIILAVLLVAPFVHAADDQQDYEFNAADAYYDADAMRAARARLRSEHGALSQTMIMADRLEYRSGDGDDEILWDAEGWYGNDSDKLVLKSSGAVGMSSDKTKEAEVQALWAHAVTPFFDLRTGVRYDFEPGGLAYGVIGLQGLAPYYLEIDAAAYISADGDLSADIDIEYEWLFTQKLALLSRTEIAISAQQIPELETGSGLTEISQSLRLRYAVSGQFIPYAGIEWRRAFGDTADFLSAAGDDVDEVLLITGINFWF